MLAVSAIAASGAELRGAWSAVSGGLGDGTAAKVSGVLAVGYAIARAIAKVGAAFGKSAGVPGE